MADRKKTPLVHGDLTLEPRVDPAYATCPFCTMQIPANAPVCPHCNSANPAADDFRSRLVEPEPFPELAAFYRKYRQPLLLGGAIALAFLVTAVVYYGWLGHKVTVARNPDFAVAVDRRVADGQVILEGSVRNLGEDVPDLSLRSVRLNVAFGLAGGGRRVVHVFPKNAHRGEGALLKGESGDFRVEMPEREVRDAALSVEVIDLRAGRPGGGIR